MALTDNGIKLLDIVVKGGFGTLIAGGVGYYGNSLQELHQREQDENRRLQSSIEMSSHQKELDVNLGMRLFGTLMSYYFQSANSPPQPEAARHRMLLLRLVALNFEDVPIHLKPLYEDLNSQLSSPEDRQALRGIAQEVAHQQAFRMTVKDAYDSGPREVKSGDSVAMPELLTTVKIEHISADSVRATIYSKVGGNRSVGPFEVTYFDEPLVDNVMLGEYRVTLILLDSEADKAQVRIIAFPKHLAADRFDIKEMSRAFQNAGRL